MLLSAGVWAERDEARLDAFDMRCQRKILRIVWSHHVTKKYVREVIIDSNLQQTKKMFVFMGISLSYMYLQVATNYFKLLAETTTSS